MGKVTRLSIVVQQSSNNTRSMTYHTLEQFEKFTTPSGGVLRFTDLKGVHHVLNWTRVVMFQAEAVDLPAQIASSEPRPEPEEVGAAA